ncbi:MULTISPECIES: hypothetical protein [unclassified Mesorhizobium]|uniref:hypothetical protein n=1 Tax=unclassified Mesorhizobium TaxID=325217 RepID=UPI0007ED130D|nr:MULTISPECIES: hypothetical protein [unclassified Mesorhizobium]
MPGQRAEQATWAVDRGATNFNCLRDMIGALELESRPRHDEEFALARRRLMEGEDTGPSRPACDPYAIEAHFQSIVYSRYGVQIWGIVKG